MKKNIASPVGRFAPSPTGPLHVGSLLAAVASYCQAKARGGRWLVRIEDLDTPRVVPGAADDILRTLDGLGFEWDGEVVYQSRRTTAYSDALEELRRQGLVYPCGCSRKEILASAPHPGEEGPVYLGTCRGGLPAGRQARAMRLQVPATKLTFFDDVFGQVEQSLAEEVGDFVLRRADGLFAYQLAVVIDDADAGVTEVVRGADLLGSTPRQIYLYRCLGLPVPSYLHLPLALSAEGEKISKRHGGLGRVEPRESGSLLWDALSFLGQPVPVSLRLAPPEEVLAWGVRCFDPPRIDPAARAWEGSGDDGQVGTREVS
ncbi:MAG TPA: tRNA glutamyl-Q(34) synthetase GluQRS [Desulfuromonadales bacterium]|nr:tRNA glutamyl-Q(34) synthetase GluQRS [Desulfuromonadales bacterium]